MDNYNETGALKIEHKGKRILYLNFTKIALDEIEAEKLIEQTVFAIDRINHMAFVENNDEALMIYDFTDSNVPIEALTDFVNSGKIIGKKIKKCAGVGMNDIVKQKFLDYQKNIIEKYPQIEGRFESFDNLNEAKDWIVE